MRFLVIAPAILACCGSIAHGWLSLNGRARFLSTNSARYYLTSSPSPESFSRIAARCRQQKKSEMNTILSERNTEILSETTTRRHFVLQTTAATLSICAPASCNAVEPTEIVSETVDATPKNKNLLQLRLEDNILTSPSYGMNNINDVLYPTYFAGVWNVSSTCTDIQAPCGEELFPGGNLTLIRNNEVGKDLQYKARFLLSDNHCILDREYNVREMLKASMGETFSLVDIPMATPNQLSCTLMSLTPSSNTADNNKKYDNRLFTVDIIAVARRQEEEILNNESDQEFDCSEVVRQIVAQATESRSSPPLSVKEVENISLYFYNNGTNGNDKIQCRQRSATYLLPSKEDPVMLRMWQATQGKPVDVRYYDMAFTKGDTKQI